MQQRYCAATRDHRQRNENGHRTVLPVSLLRVLEKNLRSFEKNRQLFLNQLKKADRQCD